MYNLKLPRKADAQPSYRDTFTAAGLPEDAPIAQVDGLHIEDCAMPGHFPRVLGTIGDADLPPVIISMGGYVMDDPPADLSHITPQTDDYVEGFAVGYFEGAMEALVNVVNGDPEDVAERIQAFTDWVTQSFGIVREDA